MHHEFINWEKVDTYRNFGGIRNEEDFVMTENHCKRKLPVDDPVGMGAYTLDSHNVQRFVHNGMVKNFCR